MIQIHGLVKRFGATTVLDGFDLEVARGETVVIKGESGCGKTTLLRIVAGLEPFEAGTVRLDGTDAAGSPPHDRGVAVAFQTPSLWPHMTVRQNLLFAMRTPDEAVAKHLLQDAEIADLADRYPAQISGGQARRASLARALAPGAPILMLDEPLSHLGAKMGARMLEWVVRQTQARGTTTVWITHSEEEAARLKARVVQMDVKER